MDDDKGEKIVKIGFQNVSVLSLLGIAFVVLKLCNVITWSWWWVTAPFWIPAVLAVGMIALLGVVVLALMVFYAVISR